MEIEIKGKKYKLSKPKARAWRELMEFDDKNAKLLFNEYVDEHINIIVKMFANPAITSDVLMDEFTVDEIMDIYRNIMTWFCELLRKKLDQIPNDQATAE